MTFAASARRARDPEQPIGHRVTSLHHCLDCFNLFGFHATRVRLRAAVGAHSSRWSVAEVMDGVALLEEARTSWLLAVHVEAERRRAAKRDGRRSGALTHREARLRWLEEYLVGETARVWRTDTLGSCSACDHLLIHHGSRGCRLCSRLPPAGLWCRDVIPAPVVAFPER